tara:strand:+ start:1542 stop:2129 length:588 start_codon:yes stop_codon:yes gene_type:complete
MKRSFLKKSIEENILVHNKIFDLHRELKTASIKIFNTLKNKKKIFICGNGGSAADAQHLAAEFLIRLRPNINRRPLPVINLAQDTSTITACANDYSFEKLFSRNLEALYSPGDLLIAISTSGMSKNIIKVLKFAKKNKIYSISLLGNSGGSAKKITNLPIVVNSKNVARIQECHSFMGHLLFEWVEDELLTQKVI